MAAFEVRGTFTIAATEFRFLCPIETLTELSNSPTTGKLLFTKIAPDDVFFPKSVP